MSNSPSDIYNKLVSRTKNHLITHPDRSRSAYFYSRLTKEQLLSRKKHSNAGGEHLANKINNDPEYLSKFRKEKKLNFKNWTTEVQKITQLIQKIQKRGGTVVLLCYPTTGKSLYYNETLCPRKIYWDKLTELTNAPTIHFQDIQGDTPFLCPESSHLNHDGATRLTKLLITELKKRKIIKTKINS